jgi:hypothetical protein
MLATAFLALDFSVVGSLIKTGATDWYVNLLAGVLSTGYLMMVFLVIDQPDEPADAPTSSTRAGPPG